MKKILLHAYGNPGRGDDGLGNVFIEEMETWLKSTGLQSVSTDSNYQLNVEDVAEMIHYDIVIFIDASTADIDSYSFTTVQPAPHTSFTTHSISPASLLSLCMELYTHHPLVYLLQIKGDQWEFSEGLSADARKNLQNAVQFAQTTILNFHNQE
ncbi:MAG: hydrogenase maturation protease [Ignavibacteriales bacterium]|nr:hydrogenase maturation protease [Ignavibacteriales bacterium]